MNSKANAAKPRAARFFKHRRRGAGSSSDDTSGIELAQLFVNTVALQPTQFQFDADDPTDKDKLGQLLWRSDLLIDPETPALRTGNPEVVQLMVLLTQNTYRHNVSIVKDTLWQEAMISNLARIKSQKVHSLLTARVTIEALRVQLHHGFWQLLHRLAPGILMSHSWAEHFVEYAYKFRPPPAYDVLPGVGCVMFDNYTRKVAYSSTHTTDSWGFRLDMTNSCSMAIPRHLARGNFNADAICECTTACPCPM